ncbi:MAG: peptidoglycan-binding protein, partial [Mesorhizobium sp.]
IDRIEKSLTSSRDSILEAAREAAENAVRTLAGAVDHFVNQQGSHNDTFGLIDERLDEISRAIVASTVAAQSAAFDPASFERIERRIESLAQQIEEVAADRPGNEMMDRLNTLSSRVDDLAARATLPDHAMERLGAQIADIAQRIEHAPALPQADALFHGIEQRFDVLSDMIERRQGEAIEHGNLLFHDLERRLNEVAEQLDRRSPEAAFEASGIMEAIDARFTALAKRLETSAPDAGGQAAIRALESRLEAISNRLDSSAAQVAAVDPELIRSLEAQVSGLSAHLSQPGTPLPVFEDIAPRIDRIEKSLTSSRDSILEAAREAAENAVRTLAGAGPETAAVAGLAKDLKTLEGLTRRSDERNTKTFEAIHDTLLKIVDRLGSLEGGPSGPAEPVAEPARAKIAVREAPALDISEALPLAGDLDAPSISAGKEPMVRTPAEAAADAARAALGSETVEQGGDRKSRLGGLARAFKLRRQSEQAEAAPVASATAEAPAVDIDEPLEPKLINRPLEPGSGAPDLNAIMKRVRDERGQPARSGEGDVAKADFIAAARRAAQAAAAEAEALKRQSTVAGPVKALRIGDLIKARRKPILMAAAAIMLALAGLQLGKAFLSDPQQTAANEPARIADSRVAMAADTSAATAPVTPSAPVESAATPTNSGDAAPVRVVDNEPDAKPQQNTAADTDGQGQVAEQDDMAMAEAAAKASNTVPAGDTQAASAAPVEAAPVAPAQNAEVASVGETTSAVAPAAAAADAAIEVPAGINPPALREAAAKGDPKALFELGSRYAEARGVKEDMAEAAKWYQKAADLGFAPAEYRIGNFYEKGTGVARDIAKSKTWYQLAAEQGNASAMHNLAVLYAMAADGTTDNQSATHWFQEAADLGVKDSQFNLGILAAKGVGMKQDLEASYKWFALVAKTGDKDAAAKRDEIANALRPEQLEKARAAVELWKAKPLDPSANTVDIPDAWQDVPTTTASIDMKKAVQNIQKILNKNGYDAGGTDGVMGDRTKKAIMAFQKDSGLEATGTVDEKLVKALLARK